MNFFLIGWNRLYTYNNEDELLFIDEIYECSIVSRLPS